MNRVGLGLAIGAGYVLGRTKKMKLAFAVGTMVAGKRMHLSPRALADMASQQLQNNPQFKEIGDQLREDLRGVGKAASGAMVERQIDALADRLHGRTAQVRDELTGMTDGATDLLEDDDEDEESEENEGEEPQEEYEDDEAESDEPENEEPEDSEPEDEERDDESEAEEEPPAKKTAKKAAKKAPARKTAAKRAPAKKAPAKKTATKQTPAKKTAKKTAARKTAAARGGARSARARLPKGGGER
ncbi:MULTISPECIES: DNA primase [unclassified Streptomyces]|uniref:DNA primase n=1 Tax=unclassified Streptomyces TaxID=2593676 RepID=UPI0022534863|nr:MULTISPECIES: DNA primase [unclassified Streptomyces]MCX5062534.1 DNA primase [Streptomyces sp. NBC_00452]MCX5291858.1 DNA primase [Streptomyces sp. NBC_00183]